MITKPKATGASTTPRKSAKITPQNASATPENDLKTPSGSQKTDANGPLDPSTSGEMTSQGRVPPGGERVQISFFVDKDGNPQIDRMRESSREEARKWLQEPKLREALGIVTARQEEIAVQVFSEEYVAGVYDALGTGETLIFGKLFGLPNDIAETIFKYKDSEKKLLVPPTQKILNKYAPDWLVQFKEEISLGILLFSINAGKIAAARAFVRLHHRKPVEMPSPPAAPPAAPPPANPVNGSGESAAPEGGKPN